ncbi:MAG: 6,7-dimethyl-8-ribityllumazine synthase [Kiritimatiellaeota bacterium]|nr:6,7-dimethyl-8-ribityllumazine synthase [Kiritimatiellota bacterium]
MPHREINGNLTADGAAFAIVISRFNSIFTSQLFKGALDAIVRHGGREEDVTVVWVPGANEIPFVAARLAALKKHDAIIALGAVIQGATSHAELINSQVSKSLAKIGLDHGVPVLNGVVCAENIEQAVERSGSKAGNKGWDAACAAIEMVGVFRALDKGTP